MTAYGRQRQPGRVDAAALAISYRDTVLLDSPVSFWPLNGASPSDVAAGRNLSFTGSVVSADGGPFGATGASAFSGSYGVTSTSYSALNPGGDVTFELWAKRTSGTDLVSAITIGPGSGNPYGCGFDTYGTGGNNRWRAMVGDGSGGAYLVVPGPATIEIDQWYHLVGVLQGATLKFYINGVLVGTNSSPAGSRYSGATYAHVARYNASYSQYWPGSLANFAFYGSALSAARVTDHYDARFR